MGHLLIATNHASTPDPGWDFLLTAAGRRCLSNAQGEVNAGTSLDAVGRKLRKTQESPDQVAAMLSQLQLRRQAASKFGDLAKDMLFTRAGLEQATRAIVADLHAERFRRAGIQSVADLGCGIGSESQAFRRADLEPRPVELDPFTAQIAAHNINLVAGAAPVQVRTGDAEALGPGEAEGVFFDPARRTRGHRETSRVTSPEDYSPSLTYAFQVATSRPTGIKLGPGFDRDLIPAEAEAEWVSVAGELVETGLWFGACARPGVKRAAVLLDRDGDQHELNAPADAPDAPVRPVGEYLYEPDGSVIRARLIGRLADELGAGMIDASIAYLTSDTAAASPFAQGFRIMEELPVREKALRRALTERGIGSLEIKKRGIDIDPAALRKRLKLKGTGSATLILTRQDGAHTAFLAERLAN